MVWCRSLLQKVIALSPLSPQTKDAQMAALHISKSEVAGRGLGYRLDS